MHSQPWWKGSTLYQIYPRSFYDASGDGIGDLKGITKKLDYIKDLGVRGIWISPFFTSPMEDFGYDVSDYKSVDKIFGSINDFNILSEKANKLDLKIIIDQVFSHTSNQHSWFQESRSDKENKKSDWYIWADPKEDGTPPNNWLSIFGGTAWEWEPRRGQYYLHNFLKSQPDLNFYNDDVQDALLDVSKFWLDLGVSGFRLDAVNFYFHDEKLRSNPPQESNKRAGQGFSDRNPYAYQKHLYDKSQNGIYSFLEKYRGFLDDYEDITTIGEIGDENALDLICAYTKDQKYLHMAYSFEFLGTELSPAYVKKVIEGLEAKIENGWVCWSFNNHDVIRSVTRYGSDYSSEDKDKLARFLIQLILSFRGTIMLYQGEELGLEQVSLKYEDIQDPFGKAFYPEFVGRDGCRTPLPWDNDQEWVGFSKTKPWLPIPEEHLPQTVIKQVENRGSLLSFYRECIELRNRSNALNYGDINIFLCDNDLLGIRREYEQEEYFLFFNFSKNNRQYDWLPNQIVDNISPEKSKVVFEQGILNFTGLSVFIGRVKN